MWECSKCEHQNSDNQSQCTICGTNKTNAGTQKSESSKLKTKWYQKPWFYILLIVVAIGVGILISNFFQVQMPISNNDISSYTPSDKETMQNSSILADEENSLVNGAGNDANGKSAALCQDIIIYENDYDEDNLYIENYDSSGDYLFYSNTNGYPNAGIEESEGWIYHIDGPSLVKTNLKTKQSIILLDDIGSKNFSSEFKVYNNYIYFTQDAYSDDENSATENLCCINSDGTNLNIIPGVEACEFTIVDGWIYYQETFSGNLYRVDLSGNNKQLIVNSWVYNIIVSNGFVYYVDGNNGRQITRTKLDGSETSTVVSNPTNSFNLLGNYIYYSNQADNGRIYCVGVDGANVRRIGDIEYALNINIVGNWMFYKSYDYIHDETGKNSDIFSWKDTYKMKLDGTENQKIVDSSTSFSPEPTEPTPTLSSYIEAFNKLQNISANEVCLTDQQSCDFSTKEFDWLSGGDLYFLDDVFYANNTPQKGIVDIGEYDNSEIIPMPNSGYTIFGVKAIVGHYYIAIDGDEESSYIIFKVNKIGEGSVVLSYVCYKEKAIKTQSDY